MPEITEFTDLVVSASNVYYWIATDGSPQTQLVFPFNYWGSGTFTPDEHIWDDTVYAVADAMVAAGMNVIRIQKSYVPNTDLGNFSAPNLPYPRP